MKNDEIQSVDDVIKELIVRDYITKVKNQEISGEEVD